MQEPPSPIGEGLSPGATPWPIFNLRERSRKADGRAFIFLQTSISKSTRRSNQSRHSIDTKKSLILITVISMIGDNKQRPSIAASPLLSRLTVGEL